MDAMIPVVPSLRDLVRRARERGYSALSCISLRPFDDSTETGRAKERYRRAMLSTFANLASKLVSMAVVAMSVRWTMPYLGLDRFGVWMTVASFVGLLTFLDLGVGNALTNRVAIVGATAGRDALTSVVSGGVGLLAIIGGLTSLVLAGLAMIIPWAWVLKSENLEMLSEARSGAMVFGLLFGANLLTSGLGRVFVGMQRGYYSHLCAGAGAVVSLTALWIGTRAQVGVPALIMSTFGVQILVNAGLGIILWRDGLLSVPSIVRSIGRERGEILRTGGLFFLLQIGTMVIAGADSLLISSNLGVEHVGEYSVVQRMFLFVSIPIGMINAPLWAAYADAHSRGEKGFIRRTLRRSMLLTVLGAAGLILPLSLFMPQIVAFLGRGSLTGAWPLIGAVGLWIFLDACANAFALFMNGCGVVTPQVYGVATLCLFAIPLKVFLLQSFGIPAMIAGFCLFFVLNLLFWYGIAYRTTLQSELGAA